MRMLLGSGLLLVILACGGAAQPPTVPVPKQQPPSGEPSAGTPAVTPPGPPADPNDCTAALGDGSAADGVTALSTFTETRGDDGEHAYGFSLRLGRHDLDCVGELVHWNADIEGQRVPVEGLVCGEDGAIRFHTRRVLTPGIRDHHYSTFEHRFEGRIAEGVLTGTFTPELPHTEGAVKVVAAEQAEIPVEYQRLAAANQCIDASLAAMLPIERDLRDIPSNQFGPGWNERAYQILCERDYDGDKGLLVVVRSTAPFIATAFDDTVRRASRWAPEGSETRGDLFDACVEGASLTEAERNRVLAGLAR